MVPPRTALSNSPCVSLCYTAICFALRVICALGLHGIIPTFAKQVDNDASFEQQLLGQVHCSNDWDTSRGFAVMRHFGNAIEETTHGFCITKPRCSLL